MDDKLKERLKELIRNPDNSTCADCGSPDPQWASVNLTVFVCIVCAGVHRSLGVHISRVKSVNLDSWKETEVAGMEQTNNIKENRNKWEATLPQDFIKPSFGDSIGLKEQWIIVKYMNKAFTPFDYVDSTLKRINLDTKEGWIVKKGDVVKSWKKRWLRLIDSESLQYFKTPYDTKPCGTIHLRDSGQVDSVSEVDSKPFCFIISTPKRRYLISCSTGEEMFKWIQLIRFSVHKLNNSNNSIGNYNNLLNNNSNGNNISSNGSHDS
ncbi:pleckstrin domain-containing protein [Cavenderia fasciculata]|uniref:Pleckstrin domain-containing protein n=1 Tax=Cavenderia fasciculata TaxID=261658 RepID=F4Q765_CACFS|nr:pleckstrin domain-containing protein [Cavenderia fasciculata]EGG16247.1 pleckstrin domain-containing protein [Cavenderia fasciculata]|eukprot:XP_004354631.1 pleckstrin domain-containing protein [Cavenderia fasciculata]